MSRHLNKLSARKVETLSRPGWHGDGGCLYLRIQHRIPLSPRAIEIFKAIAKGSNCDPGDYVFKGQRLGRPLSNMSMTMVLRRMKLGNFTVHGMRSCFRDYMGDMTDHPESIVEQALAHQIGDETTRAYRRGDAFLKRRRVMQDWETYLNSATTRLRKRQGGQEKVLSAARPKIGRSAGLKIPKAIDASPNR